MAMLENVREFFSVGKKLKESGLKSPGFADGLLFDDDPTLHRQIKQRIRQEINTTGKSPKPSTVDSTLPEELTTFLTEEVELQNTDFLIANEKISKHVFEKILKNVAHLDFRSFSTAQHSEFSLYDPEVITPQVSWAVEQVFQNLPGFFDLFDELVKQNHFSEEERVDITRNIFIMGYLHGFLSETNPDFGSIKLFLAAAIKKSNAAHEKLKQYPAFLRKLVEADKTALVSPRLDHLKHHWRQQLAQRWLMLSRSDQASADAFGLATQKQANALLPIDRRPADSLVIAKKMDALEKIKTAFRGGESREITSAKPTNESSQAREELHLAADTARIEQSTVLHMRDILRLYQGNNQEPFHNGRQVTEKWSRYKTIAESVLQKLVLGFAELNEVKSDDAKFNTVLGTIVESMVEIVGNSEENAPFLVKGALEEMFGKDFFGLAKIEQLSLMSFTALSFLNRETETSKLAIQILDRLIVPRLDQYFDLERTQKALPEDSSTFNFSVFEKQLFAEKSQQAKLALTGLTLNDGLVSVDSDVFLKIFKNKQQLLSGVSKIYSLFASLTNENWGNKLKWKPIILSSFFAITAFISGYLNFNLTQDFLTDSLKNSTPEDIYAVLKNIQMLLVAGAAASGALVLGDKARRDFKKLSLSSSKIKTELTKFSKVGWRQAAVVSLLSMYALGSTYPLVQDKAEEWWDTIKDRWEEMFKDEAEKTGSQQTEKFWENRNPEATDKEDLRNLEKVDWGEIVIAEDVYGKNKNSPIGFINTFVVSPIPSDPGNQQYETEADPSHFESALQANGIVVNAQKYYVDGNNLVFELADGSTYIQPASGSDFVVKNGLANGVNGLVRFLDTGRYIDKIITVPAASADGGAQYFYDDQNFKKYDSPEDYYPLFSAGNYEYFVVYKTNASITNEMSLARLQTDENLDYWEAHAEDRKIIQEVLQKENPAAAALYAQMLEEQQQYWDSYSPEIQRGDEYLEMLKKQIADYDNFVRVNHVYSLEYDPKTEYATQYPNVGVLLDVMSLKTGGYYCLTAHLAAQEWFLSLGVPMSGLYGYHVYDDGGTARSRIGHVQTGVYGAVYDFTPSTPNPGEDLSALAFDENTFSSGQQNIEVVNEQQEAFLDLLQKLGNPDNLALLIILLTGGGLSYAAKLGIGEIIRGKSKNSNIENTEEQRQILPDDEAAMRSLTVALFQLLGFVTDQRQLGTIGSEERTQAVSQLIAESLALATAPPKAQTERLLAIPFNSDISALMQSIGLISNSPNPNVENQIEKLSQKLSVNKKQTEQLLREIVSLLDKTSTEFRKTYQLKVATANRSVRKLQRQLSRIRRKEASLYGVYGKVLETTQLVKDEKINELRRKVTANYLTLQHEIEKENETLREYAARAKLLPTNVQNLKKIFSFIIDAINNPDLAHE